MPITVGSIGDIIAVCLVVKDLVDALDKSRGSASEYQEIIRELRCLDRSLLEVEKLSRELDNSAELHAIRVTAKLTVDKCRSSVDGFLGKIRKYEKYLREEGSGNVVKNSAMKMKWQLFRSSELAKFRVEVIVHYSSINTLIASAQLNRLRMNDTKLKERLSGGEQQNAATAEKQEAILTDIRDRVEENRLQIVAGKTALGRIADSLRLQWLRDMSDDLRSLIQQTFQMNIDIYKAVLSIQTSLLGNLDRTLIQEPFILEDAIGRLCPVHLQFICSWEAFEDVLEHRFRGLQGHNMVLQKAWVMQELATCRDISRKTPWTSAFLPGQKVGMDMVFRKQEVIEMPRGTTTCPSCNTPSSSGYGRSIKCAGCGLHYHRIIEESEKPNHPSNPQSNKESNPHSRQESNLHSSRGKDRVCLPVPVITTISRKRKLKDLIVRDEEMSHFKRVRVVTKKIENDAGQDMMPLPNRVLDVQMTSSACDTIRLCLTNNSPARYACLSWDWDWDLNLIGKTTTSATISEYFNRIIVSDLPTTIQDAIFAVRNLGLRFLWVDALCIVQGDNQDWDRESCQMEAIFQNAYITLLGATCKRRARLCSDGSLEDYVVYNGAYQVAIHGYPHGLLNGRRRFSRYVRSLYP